jgi:triosephosphate isomerase (TIM)
MKLPLIIINFKTYQEATGENALKLAQICEKVAKDTNTNIIIAPQTADIHMISQKVSIPVFSQHVDPINSGANTGSISIESVKAAGAKGTLVNHSEKRLRIDEIEKIVSFARKIGLTTVVCANDPTTGKALNSLTPNFVAVEPPELIGGDISVSTSKPEIITESVFKICDGKKCNQVIVGAGIKNGQDVKKAIELGAVGVLVASGVVLSKNPEKALLELISGTK